MARFETIRRVVDLWRSRGVDLLPPSSEGEVVATFRGLGVPVSADVVELYGLTGGFDDSSGCGWDGMWNLWPLDQIRAENVRTASHHVIFADWLIDSHDYALSYESTEVSSVDVGEGAIWVPSLSEFFETYMTDPDAVWAFQVGG